MYRKIFVHFWCAEKTGPNLFEEVFKNMVKIFGKADEIFVFSPETAGYSRSGSRTIQHST